MTSTRKNARESAASESRSTILLGGRRLRRDTPKVEAEAAPAPSSGQGSGRGGRRRRLRRFGFGFGALAAFGVLFFFYQKEATIPNPDPEIERKSFQVADGFEVSLFAGDPLLAKPIQMNFDAQGRLWVASSEVYPQIEPGQAANDKIIVLEDTDKDGKADKTTVFADKLLIPTGVEPGDGGAYVANSTELVHFKDTDGDGKADQRRVVLSGFGTEDTHHILHTLRWGPDGLLYMNQSIYIHSHIETPHGVRRLNGSGIWAFRPETMELDVFMRGLVNPWGHHFDRFGQSFATDGAGGEGINYVVPGGSYFTAVGADRIIKGLNPGSPKHCGLEILSGRHLPESWRGSMITNDFRGNRVCRFVVSDDGSGFASREQPEVIKTNHRAFRPIDVKMGPDGAIYIADWYNPIIQHGEVDFRDPRRDHTHGRIWRVTAKGRKTVDAPKLVGATDEELLEYLKAPEDFTRHFAKRVMKERGKSVLPALASFVSKLDADGGPEADHHRLEALWTYQSLDVVEPKLLRRLAKSEDPRVRAAAMRVANHWLGRFEDPFSLLSAGVADANPRVRLETVRALGRVPEPKGIEIALKALDKPLDRFLDYGLWLAIREQQHQWLPALREGKFHYDDPKHLVYALESVGSPEVVGPLVEALRAGKVGAGEQQRVQTLIASLGGPTELGMILDLAVAQGTAPERRVALLDAIGQATTRRNVLPAGDLRRLGSLIDSDNATVRAAAIKSAGLWKAEAFRETLSKLASDAGTPVPIRFAAIDAVAKLGGAAAVKVLDALTSAIQPLPVRARAVAAWVSVDPVAAATKAVPVLADSHEGDATHLVQAFVERQGGPPALAAALTNKKLPMDVAKLGVRVVDTSGRRDGLLIEALSRAGGLTTGPKTMTPAERSTLLADVVSKGDPARGEQVFRRAASQCLNCHAIAGAGGQVGPSLESIGASAQADYILDSLLEPNKAVKENYNATIVATADGKILTGIKVRQSDTALVLRDSEDKEISIPTDQIEEQKPGLSLMPAGLIEGMTRAELVDLVRFMSELGKIGPYAVSKAPVIRRWQVLQPSPEALARTKVAEFDALATLIPGPFVPAYSKVSGELPVDSIPKLGTFAGSPPVGLARAQLDVSTPGKVRLKLDPASVALWLDGKRVDAKGPEVDLDLATGTRNLTFLVELPYKTQSLRCDLIELPGSPAKVQPVIGK